jgi:hypothetical protein
MIGARFVEHERETLVRVEGRARRATVAPHDARLVVGIRPGHDCARLDGEEHGHDQRKTSGPAGLFRMVARTQIEFAVGIAAEREFLFEPGHDDLQAVLRRK